MPASKGVQAGVKQGEIQYRAFISYSHADRRVVEWLHRALESYRLPAKLVGQITPLGPVPARLGSLFRDRDELPAAGNPANHSISRSLPLVTPRAKGNDLAAAQAAATRTGIADCSDWPVIGS
ncbi:MAG: hypothetical protein ACRC1J_12910 [Sandaracinobacteroides sp.]